MFRKREEQAEISPCRQSENKSLLILKKYHVLENFLLNILDDSEISLNYKELND